MVEPLADEDMTVIEAAVKVAKAAAMEMADVPAAEVTPTKMSAEANLRGTLGSDGLHR
jgi:hypothetical protein